MKKIGGSVKTKAIITTTPSPKTAYVELTIGARWKEDDAEGCKRAWAAIDKVLRAAMPPTERAALLQKLRRQLRTKMAKLRNEEEK